MKLYCDNMAAIHISSNQFYHEHAKHIGADYLLMLRNELQQEMLCYEKSEDQLSNFLTQSIDRGQIHHISAKWDMIDVHSRI